MFYVLSFYEFFFTTKGENMKYHYYLFIMICFLSIAVPCNAMKKENRLHCIEEMTAVKHPLRVQYLAKDRVAMSNSKGCFIVDLTTKEAQQIDRGYGDPEVRVFSTQNGNKKIVSSWSWIDVCGGSVKIYNAETGALEWDKEGDNACFMACSSYDNAIYLAGEKGIVKHNYVTKNYEDIPINDRHCQYSLVMHPKKEILCIAEFDPGVLSFYTLDNVTVPFKTITLPVASYFCQYSPDGSYVVAGDLRDLFIIDPNREGDQYPCIKSKASEDFSVISFHPNSSVLAILSRH